MEGSSHMKHVSSMDAAKTIVQRYLASHEDGQYTWRPFVKRGIYRREDYRYHADLQSLLPSAPLGSYSYIWGVYPSTGETTLRFALIPYGPVKLFVNGVLVGESDIFSERYRSKQILELPMKKGFNDLVLLCENTSGGFGCEFGTWVGKLDYYFLMPSLYGEMEGLCYSAAQETLLETLTLESLHSLDWYPERPELPGESVDLTSIFPDAKEGQCAVLATSFTLEEDLWCTFRSNARLFLDDLPVEGSLELQAGRHTLLLHARIESPVTLEVLDAKTNDMIEISNPVLPASYPYRYLIAGPFDARPDVFSFQYTKPFPTANGEDFWHLEGEDTYLRMYNDNPLFGHWNYPLGVTLYGLVETERMLSSSDPSLAYRIAEYLENHIQASLDSYAYAMWDKEHLGGSTAVHHLMTSLDSLDDCGSFASTVLEVGKDHELHGFEEIIEVVRTYISKIQPRLSDGTFFRTGLMHEFHENTMWVDDLYMSVPFLIRYSIYAKDDSYLEDAINQFFGFAKYLYMEDKGLMSHVYDFERNIATGIPWGRGNGWALFSLSELLMVLPDNHSKRKKLLTFFRSLSEGFLRHQDEEGMFHQVLDMKSSYQESSCTAMAACAFSRGVRQGWYENPEPYREGCLKACDGLKKKAIDGDGHVHGVCRGSEFSCSRHYYAEQLLPRLDDTHGIGIILLALCEGEKLG